MQRWTAALGANAPLEGRRREDESRGGSRGADPDPDPAAVLERARRSAELEGIRHAARTEHAGVEEAFTAGLELALASLQTLLLLVKGQYAEAQEWVRQQGSHTRSTNLLTVVRELLEKLVPEIPVMLQCDESRVASLLLLVAQTLAALLAGPCETAQLELARAGVTALVMKAWKHLHVDLEDAAGLRWQCSPLHPIPQGAAAGAGEPSLLLHLKTELQRALLGVLEGVLEGVREGSPVSTLVGAQLEVGPLLEYSKSSHSVLKIATRWGPSSRTWRGSWRRPPWSSCTGTPPAPAPRCGTASCIAKLLLNYY
jgi:hypothetical protein